MRKVARRVKLEVILGRSLDGGEASVRQHDDGAGLCYPWRTVGLAVIQQRN